MNLHIKHIISFLVLVFLVMPVMAQEITISGRISDEQTSDPLPFANIGVKDTSIGSFSDEKGNYRLTLPVGNYILVVSSVGYETVEKIISSTSPKAIHMDIQMRTTMQELNTVVVSASKYAQRIQESISSIEVLKANRIESSNLQTIDKALDKIPGVTVMDNEPQIRAGSGFASGLGSRVMVMVDEIPLLRGDAGRPVWHLMPVHEIEQIEVVKGASSVVYGSAALSGAINVRTAWPSDKMQTKVTAFTGIYSKPERRYTTPWSGWNPMQFGLTVSHMQKFEHIDVGASLSYYNDQGHLGTVPEEKDSSGSTTGAYDRWIKFNFNSRVRAKNVNGLTYGLNGTLLTGKTATTYFWLDSDTNIYRPFPNSITNMQELTFYIDPFLKYFGPKGSVHNFRNRFFYNNSESSSDQSNMSFTVYNEYQYQKKFRNLGDLVIVAGIMNTYSYAYGQVFSGKLAPDSTTTLGEYGTYTSDNLAVYTQIEKKFFKRLTVLLGARYEFFTLGDLSEGKPVFRAGVNLQASKSTFIRASVGQGYRFPSIGERYITTNTGNFGFYPNPQLIAENSLNTELGIKQMFRFGKFAGFADLAGFYETYENYIEFNFGMWGRSSDFSKNMGFKFFNTGPARIYGIDFNIMGQGEIIRTLNMSVLLGYTYAMPQSTDTGYVFYSQPNLDYTYVTTSTNPEDQILKYRLRHIIKGDLELSRKRWSGGISGRYYSFIENIDKFFETLETWPAGNPAFDIGIMKYREEHNKGTFLMDLRVSYMLRSFRFSVIVDNLFNNEFSLRPGTIEPTRLTTMQVIYKI